MVLYEDTTIESTNPAVTDIFVTTQYMKAATQYCKENPGKYVRIKLAINNKFYSRHCDVVVWYGKRPDGKRNTMNYVDLTSPYFISTKKSSTSYKDGTISYNLSEVREKTDKSVMVSTSFKVKPFTHALLKEDSHRNKHDNGLSVKVEEFDYDTFVKLSKINLESEASMRTNKSLIDAKKLYDDEVEFKSKRAKCIKAPYINAGSCVPFGLIGNEDDFMEWYCSSSFSAEMADSYRTTCSERMQIDEAASNIIEELGFTKVSLYDAQERFIKDHPEGGYCLYMKRKGE